LILCARRLYVACRVADEHCNSLQNITVLTRDRAECSRTNPIAPSSGAAAARFGPSRVVKNTNLMSRECSLVCKFVVGPPYSGTCSVRVTNKPETRDFARF
jgi:hypothetical protein